ncbi:MAG TPA: CbiX/SirB N-terminal domain-containing protein [Bryobacteraceae bacterium]|nr:CbiX/SirB N-terminal domain-containing protein [Bryobacteraceae bacterium]
MTRIFRLLLIWGAMFAVVEARAAEFGVVVVAHGVAWGTWNQEVESRMAELRLPWPMEVSFLSSQDGNTIQRAFDRLAAAGVRKVVVVPLLVSSHSSHVDEIRYYLGLAPKPAEEHITTPPVRTALPVRMTHAIDYHQLISAEFCRRASAISENRSRETVLLVGHGPNEEDNNRLWLAAFERYAGDLKGACGFHEARGLTVRDDASEAVQAEAREILRKAASDAASDGTALVLPFLIGSGGVAHNIARRLEGIPFRISREGLIHGDALKEWVTATAAEAVSEWSLAEVARRNGVAELSGAVQPR